MPSACWWLGVTQLLPSMKKVRQFGIMDIVEERRIRDDQIDGLVWKPCCGRVSTGQIYSAGIQFSVFGPIVNLAGERRRANLTLNPGQPGHFRRCRPICDCSQQTVS